MTNTLLVRLLVIIVNPRASQSQMHHAWAGEGQLSVPCVGFAHDGAWAALESHSGVWEEEYGCRGEWGQGLPCCAHSSLDVHTSAAMHGWQDVSSWGFAVLLAIGWLHTVVRGLPLWWCILMWEQVPSTSAVQQVLVSAQGPGAAGGMRMVSGLQHGDAQTQLRGIEVKTSTEAPTRTHGTYPVYCMAQSDLVVHAT